MIFDPEWFKGKTEVSVVDTSLIYSGNEKPSFNYGVEILNDDITPMAFAIDILKSIVGLNENNAVTATLRIHALGKVIIMLPNQTEATSAANKIDAQAKHNNYPLACKTYIAQRSIQPDA